MKEGMGKMKAIIYTRYGPPEVAQLAEVDKPVPKANEVLIRVHSATVNRTDCGFRSAEYFIVRFFSGLFRPKNKILGNEFAGVVEAVGNAVTLFRTGDKVFGYNDKNFGAHAEYMTMAEDAAMATMPENADFDLAAASTEGAHYALCDIRAAKIGKGQNVLVNGGTGAIGSAAVQLIKHLGARVTAVCHGRHLELVKNLGADRVIDYTSEDFTKLNETFDVVFDAVGKSSFRKCRPILKKKGIYMSTELGYMSANVFLALLTPLLGAKKVLFPIPVSTKKDVEYLKELVATRKFRPLIDRHYRLDQVAEAYAYVETGQKTGNVIIKVME